MCCLLSQVGLLLRDDAGNNAYVRKNFTVLTAGAAPTALRAPAPVVAHNQSYSGAAGGRLMLRGIADPQGLPFTVSW